MMNPYWYPVIMIVVAFGLMVYVIIQNKKHAKKLHAETREKLEAYSRNVQALKEEQEELKNGH